MRKRLLSSFFFLCVAAAAFAQDEPFAAIHQSLNSKADADLRQMQAILGVHPAQARAPVPQRLEKPVPAIARVQELRATIDPILRDAGLPPEISAVALVESGGRTTALSPKGALGVWQLMPATARRYGLQVSPVRDERSDVVKATRAAARHLRDLYDQFGDWKLALAAYNAGGQAVTRAINRAGTADFTRISQLLPAETRHYVPAVLAAQSSFHRGAPRIVFALAE